MFDADWEQPRPDRARRARRRGLGRAQERRRAEARSRAPAGAHAGDLLRGAVHQAGQHGHGLHVRPPRQAARVQRLAQRPRAVDAQARGRQALRPRRRRRRLRDLRRDHRDPGARPPGHRAPAHRRPDRDLRGKRLVRPAGLPRRAATAPGQREPRRLPRLGRRQLRPALAHDQPARHGQRRAQGRDPDRRHPLGRRQRPRAVELSHPAPGARPPRGFEDRPPVAAELSLRDSRRARSRRRRRRRASSATRSGSASPGPAAPTARRACRRRPSRSRRCSTAPGGRRCR